MTPRRSSPSTCLRGIRAGERVWHGCAPGLSTVPAQDRRARPRHIPVLGDRSSHQCRAPARVRSQQFLGRRDGQPLLGHGRSQQRVLEQAHPLGHVGDRALDRVRHLLQRPAAGAHQLGQRVRFLLRRQILTLEILDQVQEIGLIGIHRPDERGDVGPPQGLSGGQASQSGGQDEAVTLGANADRLLQAVLTHRVGEGRDIPQGPTRGAAWQEDAVERDVPKLEPVPGVSLPARLSAGAGGSRVSETPGRAHAHTARPDEPNRQVMAKDDGPRGRATEEPGSSAGSGNCQDVASGRPGAPGPEHLLPRGDGRLCEA